VESDPESGISFPGLRELELPLSDAKEDGAAAREKVLENMQEVMDIWGGRCGTTVEFWKGDLTTTNCDSGLTMEEISSLFVRFPSLRVAHFDYADSVFLGEESEGWSLRSGRRENCLRKLVYGIPSLEEIHLGFMSVGIRRDGDMIGIAAVDPLMGHFGA
jgi:hypothetical protein